MPGFFCRGTSHSLSDGVRHCGLAPALEGAFREGGVQLVVAPIDYSENTRVLIDELRGAAPKRE